MFYTLIVYLTLGLLVYYYDYTSFIYIYENLLGQSSWSAIIFIIFICKFINMPWNKVYFIIFISHLLSLIVLSLTFNILFIFFIHVFSLSFCFVEHIIFKCNNWTFSLFENKLLNSNILSKLITRFYSSKYIGAMNAFSMQADTSLFKYSYIQPKVVSLDEIYPHWSGIKSPKLVSDLYTITLNIGYYSVELDMSNINIKSLYMDILKVMNYSDIKQGLSTTIVKENFTGGILNLESKVAVYSQNTPLYKGVQNLNTNVGGYAVNL